MQPVVWKISGIIFGLFFSTVLSVQEDEMELAEKVSQLQQQLESQEIPQRDDAEQALIELGPNALDHLLPAEDDSTSDVRDRLGRIRGKLETMAVTAVSQSSKVTLKGQMSVAEAIDRIEKQTANKLIVADREVLEKVIQMDCDKVEFWPAMNQLLVKSQLQVDRYGGQPGVLNLIAAGDSKPVFPTTVAKIFQLSATRVDSSLNLGAPKQDWTSVQIQVRWEPRLRPISVDIPMSTVQAIDEYGDRVPVANANEVVYGMVQPEIPELEFHLRLARVDRQVEELKSITAKINAVLPGRIETFRFKNLDDQRRGWSQKQAGAMVTFGGIQKNEDLFGVIIELKIDEEHNALESHRGWVFENEVYILDQVGKRQDSVSMETLQQDNSLVKIQYFFLENPNGDTLIYKTPAAIVHMPVEFTLTKIPLP